MDGNNGATRNRRPDTTDIVLGLLLFRLFNSFNLKTFFQPDEYFQALEPAWQLAFGEQSGAWITWEWREHLRSSLHPTLFAAFYKLADQIAHLVSASPVLRGEILVTAPTALQTTIAAIGDLSTWGLACKLYGERSRASWAALALTVLSPWQWFCSVRTFSNSLETTLTVAALYFWPWTWFLQQDRKRERSTTGSKGNGSELSTPRLTAPHDLYISLGLAAVACILRPTNLIIWATISICTLYRYGSFRKASVLAQSVVVCGSAVLALSISMDRVFYGEWTFPPLKFLYVNVLQSLSVFYGQNRPDYYFTEGLPLLLTTSLPFAVNSIWQALQSDPDKLNQKGDKERQSRFVLATAVITTVIVLSLISHKEVRFIYPLLPILHILAARPLAAFFHPFPLPAKKVRLALMVLMVAANVFIAAYVGFVHQRGVIAVMHYLRHEQEARLYSTSFGGTPTSNANMTVGFFMPCHSTPWRSHFVHPETHAWALTCEPPLNKTAEERQHYQDEADIFYADPPAWINANMEDRTSVSHAGEPDPAPRYGHKERGPWPEYLVFFEHLEPTMSVVLQGSRYRECWRGFNTHCHDDGRRQGDVVVWCLR